jgi:hypothetical protein
MNELFELLRAAQQLKKLNFVGATRPQNSAIELLMSRIWGGRSACPTPQHL